MEISELLDKVKIEDVISQYVTLQVKNAENLKGLCPFHSDKNPSFLVNILEKYYKCFGCGKGGNVIHFVSEINNISFIEAYNFLAKSVGLETQSMKIDVLKEINNHFQSKSDRAIEYLTKRKFSEDIIHEFKLGWGGEVFELTEVFPHYLSILIELGIVKVKNENTPGQIILNLLNRRVTIPIETYLGIVAFSGRAISDGIEKYLNTFDNEFYSKNSTLFNLKRAIPTIKQEDFVILTEGFFDVMRLYSAGYFNVVSTMGVSVSDSHIRTLSKITKRVLLMYDADTAGFEAIKKVAFHCLRHEIRFSVCLLPEGHDPDSFLRDGGDITKIPQFNDSEIYSDLFTEEEARSFVNTLQTEIKLPKEFLYKFKINPDKLFKSQPLIREPVNQVKMTPTLQLALFVNAFPNYLMKLNENEIDLIEEQKQSKAFLNLNLLNYFRKVKDPDSIFNKLRGV